MAHPTALLARRLGAFFGLLGVILGAFGAHALKPVLLKNGTWDTWHTAVLYQFIHALTLLALAQGTLLRKGIVISWTIGVLFFSGSLYLLALDPTQRWAGPITPLGGAALIVGWVWLLVVSFTGKNAQP